MLVNVENINKIIMHLRNEENYFNMEDWTNHSKYDAVYPENICGTPSCIGGWAEAIMIYEGVDYAELDASTDISVIADWLGISDQQACHIFYPGSDLSVNTGLIDPYNATRYQAIKLLENLIETGEVNWNYAMGVENVSE